MSQQRTAVLIALSIGALATFMPWISNGITSISGSKGDGWISFAFYFSGILVLLAGGKTERILDTKNGNIIILLSLCATLFGIWKIWKFFPQEKTIEFGLYFVVLSGLFIPILTWLTKGEKEIFKIRYRTELGVFLSVVLIFLTIYTIWTFTESAVATLIGLIVVFSSLITHSFFYKDLIEKDPFE